MTSAYKHFTDLLSCLSKKSKKVPNESWDLIVGLQGLALDIEKLDRDISHCKQTLASLQYDIRKMAATNREHI